VGEHSPPAAGRPGSGPHRRVIPKGSTSPFVSDFGQDKAAKNPPDFLLWVHQGDNYGFPQCNRTKAKACRGFTKPFMRFSPHTDVGGLAIIGNRLYISEFGFTKLHPPAVVSMPLSGGKITTVLKGFVAPVIGLGAHGGWLYVGELTGQVFRIKA
jgi:glucose/arabinose dehydrogenase